MVSPFLPFGSGLQGAAVSAVLLREIRFVLRERSFLKLVYVFKGIWKAIGTPKIRF
jgi:ABC-type polysaccharide transport system permease subunit